MISRLAARIVCAWTIAALCFARTVQPVSAFEVTVRTVDGTETVGHLTSFSLDGSLDWQPAETGDVKTPAYEIVAITSLHQTPPAPPTGAAVYLSHQGLLFGEIGDTDENGLELTSPLLGRLRVPLECVTAMVTERGRRTLSASAVRAAARRTDRDTDELWFANGDRLSGSLLAINHEYVLVETGSGSSQTPTEYLLGVFLAEAPPAADRKPRGILRLVDSSAVPVNHLRWYGPEVQAASEDWLDLAFAAKHLASLEVLGGRWRWLGSLVPSEYEQSSLAGARWPYRIDANVMDEPLSINGRTYDRGIGLHSAARLVYYLGGDYEAFVARVGMDDSAGSLADADFEILVDERTAFRRTGIGRAEPPIPVRLDIDGVQRLEIRVGFGRNGDIQDRVNLADAALIRRAAPPVGPSAP
ncbi:MAG: NPCBM/NEW2 domain-containing protein [Phycisphaerales bacterium]|nr:MAG: NPCBM/NEW2 domain-containing protein [Phycisphaerales bacterium]